MALRHAGFAASQISLFAPDPRETEGFAEELGIHVVQAGTAGVAAGGVVGGLAGWLVGLAGLSIPGIGLIVAAGPVAGAILGAVSGASVGGFVGLLVGVGLPHHAAEEYARALKAGRTLVFVHPEDRLDEAETALLLDHPIAVHHFEDKVGA